MPACIMPFHRKARSPAERSEQSVCIVMVDRQIASDIVYTLCTSVRYKRDRSACWVNIATDSRTCVASALATLAVHSMLKAQMAMTTWVAAQLA